MARFRRHTLFLLICLLASRSATAGEVLLRDIVVTNSSTDLLLFLKLDDALSPEIIEGVQSGLEATLKFEVRINLVRAGWPDKEIYRSRIEHSLGYDTLKKEYRLTLVENGAEQCTVDNLHKAELMMTELNGVKLLPLRTMQPDRQYVLKVRAVMAQTALPSYVNYLIPFSNVWNVKTDWYTVRFRY